MRVVASCYASVSGRKRNRKKQRGIERSRYSDRVRRGLRALLLLCGNAGETAGLRVHGNFFGLQGQLPGVFSYYCPSPKGQESNFKFNTRDRALCSSSRHRHCLPRRSQNQTHTTRSDVLELFKTWVCAVALLHKNKQAPMNTQILKSRRQSVF